MKGEIEQIGSPEEVYDHPNSPFVYDFLGNVNLFHGRMENGKLLNVHVDLDSELTLESAENQLSCRLCKTA